MLASDRYPRHLPPAPDPPHHLRFPGIPKRSSATAEATQYPAGQARGGALTGGQAPPPETPALSWGRPAEPSAGNQRGDARALAILGTGSQLPREAQKERGIIMRHSIVLQKQTRLQSLNSSTERSEGRRNTRSPSSACSFTIK